MDDLSQYKSLEELERFRNDLRRAQQGYPSCCELGRDPLGGSQYRVLQEYDRRIARVEAEIARRKQVTRSARIAKLIKAMNLLNEYAMEIEGRLRDQHSPEYVALRREMLGETMAELRSLIEELERA
ncbi:MAG: hypothetical protein ACOYUZ_01530 [Patescibacteria group bacterium]